MATSGTGERRDVTAGRGAVGRDRRVGYHSPSAFVTAFRQVLGSTPDAFLREWVATHPDRGTFRPIRDGPPTAALAMMGCATDAVEPGGTSKKSSRATTTEHEKGAFPVSIEHELGTFEPDEAPERIVTIG
ncbi:hypothetical protein ACFV0R_29905 [Streptomyces sp. NPDC059578]|uniref:hypothetical protein n=1 Tax=Streptomyces sp. NPDC059578 TaxID=3346874 RepID=UPI0036AB9FB8